MANINKKPITPVIMIVDDDDLMLSTLEMHVKDFLKNKNRHIAQRFRNVYGQDISLEVKSFLDEEAAKEEIETNIPAILLVDFSLKTTSGLYLLGQLRAQSKGPPEVMILSGWPDVDNFTKKHQLTAWLQKPAELGDLERALIRCLKHLLANAEYYRFVSVKPVKSRKGRR